jgi:hypothetical protein
MDRRCPTLYADGRDFHNLVCDRHQVWNGLEGHSRKHCVETGDNDAFICANQLVNKVNDCLVEELRRSMPMTSKYEILIFQLRKTCDYRGHARAASVEF